MHHPLTDSKDCIRFGANSHVQWSELLARISGHFMKYQKGTKAWKELPPEKKAQKQGDLILQELHALSPRPGEESRRFKSWLLRVHNEAPPVLHVQVLPRRCYHSYQAAKYSNLVRASKQKAEALLTRAGL